MRMVDAAVAMDVSKELHGYPSIDGKSTIKAVFWVPAAVKRGERPKAVMQLIHGMGEHIGRYDRYARAVASTGVLVCGNDHVGHGMSAGIPERFGLLPEDDPVATMVEDADGLRRIVQGAMAPDLPYFLFGHSMGSLILRCYLPIHGRGLTGAIVCGTTMPNRLASGLGNLLARAFVALRGPDAKSKLLHRLAYGVYSHRIADARTPFDWISSDPREVDAFIEDEGTGFVFTGMVYVALTEGAYRAAAKSAFQGIPKQLPVLLIAGDCDPVGGNGKQVEKVGDRMRRAGVESTTIKLYGGMRHEILNEAGREEVYADVASWMDEVMREAEMGAGCPPAAPRSVRSEHEKV